ncbi:hypothetical protein B0A49_06244 [Cryomyces minteri]|uniref:Uncharacterized protein n=1 Tax=Cryomyces minteri TaxID=331657 RepID=A0A4V5NFC1_9PEZI|nr:hypothetical protein B0A49_06244 [Cryomyces minteri]
MEAVVGYGASTASIHQRLRNVSPALSPYGEPKYLWGNVPALDLLDLEQNEGIDDSSMIETGKSPRGLQLAKNNVYGGLFFYLQELLHQFCDRPGNIKVSFQLSHVDPTELLTATDACRTEDCLLDRIGLRFVEY